jgi:hypothetical protein
MSNSEPFTKMAARIEHNLEGSTFGGAVVIVPPVGEQIEMLTFDSGSAAAAVFWSTLKTRIQMEIDKLEEQQRTAGGFGRR